MDHRHHSFPVGAENLKKIVPGINMAPTAAGYNHQKIKIFRPIPASKSRRQPKEILGPREETL